MCVFISFMCLAIMLPCAQKLPKSLSSTMPGNICFVCTSHCSTFFFPFMCTSVVCYLILFFFCRYLPLCVFAPMFMCLCDELAGNWLLNGATAAMWDKIETRETERPIHLLSAKSDPHHNWPFHQAATHHLQSSTHTHISANTK